MPSNVQVKRLLKRRVDVLYGSPRSNELLGCRFSIRGQDLLARQTLRKLLAGPIYFAPVVRLRDRRRTFHFEGNVDAGSLLDRTLTTLASPRGFVPYTSSLVVPFSVEAA